MRLLITGAEGMLGTDLMALARAGDFHVVGVDVDDCDITDMEQVKGCFAEAKPEVVINCAAYTRVDAAEAEPDAALSINRDGAARLAAAAALSGARMVQVSTDYVYAGDLGRRLREDDPEEPESAYGRSKLEGDLAVRRLVGDHAIARSAWLYGVHGRNFVSAILEQARAGKPLRVVDDQLGSPTWTVHLAEALLRLARSRFTGTLHVANRGAVSWHELAREALRRSGLGHVPVARMESSELGRPAPRPACSALDTTLYATLAGGPLPVWTEALAGYLARLEEAAPV